MIVRGNLGATTTLKRTNSGTGAIAAFSPQAATRSFIQKRKDDDITPLSLDSLEEQIQALQREPTQEEIDALVAEYDDSSDSVSDTSDVMDSETVEDVIFKVLVVGNARCGKTSTIRRYVSSEFSEIYASTIGADFIEKVIEYDTELRIHLQLWDIAGQDRFAKLTRAYFRDAKGALIVCDITRENTIDAVVTWKTELDACCKDLNDGQVIPVVMVANKSDLLLDPMNALNIGVNMQKCVTNNNILEWFRASAKSGEHVNDAFQCLLDRMVQDYRQTKNEEISSSASIDETEEHQSEIIRLSQYPDSHSRPYTENGMCDCN